VFKMAILYLVCVISICVAFFRTVMLTYKDTCLFYATNFFSILEVFPVIIFVLVDIFTVFFWGEGGSYQTSFCVF